jgi:hypothetical protein
MGRVTLWALAMMVTSATTASAQMSDGAMRSARNAARQLGQAIAQYELCGINTEQAKNKVLKFAEETCDGSTSQVETLNDLIDTELSRTTKTLNNQGYSCSWSFGEAQGKFDQLINALDRQFSRGCD